MSQYDSRAEKRTGRIAPTTIDLGTDETGADHVYRLTDDAIHVVRADGTRDAVVPVEGRRLEGWMYDVASTRGWADARYGVLGHEANTATLKYRR